MEDINLHFTGDFAAIAVATNLLAALIDNHIHRGNALGIDVRRITWRRVLDVNDRALRDVVVGLGGPDNGYPARVGLRHRRRERGDGGVLPRDEPRRPPERLGDIVIGYTRDRRPVRARDLDAHGAMTAILRDALAPNLVQTLEHTPAFVHGGPFANIAHGCNSVVATRAGAAARRLRRHRGRIRLRPRRGEVRRHPVPLVRAAPVGRGDRRDGAGDEVPRRRRCRRPADRERRRARAGHRQPRPPPRDRARDARAARRRRDQPPRRRHRRRGRRARRAPSSARARAPSSPATSPRAARAPRSSRTRSSGCATSRPSCASPTPTTRRCGRRCRRSRRASTGHPRSPRAPRSARRSSACRTRATARYPVCVAKTQYSFSTDPKLRGAPTGHVVDIREVRLAAGRRVRRHGLRRHHDDAGPARGAGRGRRSTSTRTGGSSACSERRIMKTERHSVYDGPTDARRSDDDRPRHDRDRPPRRPTAPGSTRASPCDERVAAAARRR